LLHTTASVSLASIIGCKITFLGVFELTNRVGSLF